MKVVVLHGYGQNDQIIKKKLRRYHLPENTIYINGMWDLHDGTYAWYLIHDVKEMYDKFPRGDGAWISNKCILNLYKEELKNVDILIGFSQGALTAFFLAYEGHLKPKKVLLFSPPIYRDIYIQWFEYCNPYDKPKFETMIVHGKVDDLIDIQKSLDYYTKLCRDDVEYLEHDHGHCIPTKSEYRKRIMKFLGI